MVKSDLIRLLPTQFRRSNKVSLEGIPTFGQLLKPFLFFTNVVIITSTNANAVIAVYPFTPQPMISQSLILAADKPIFCEVGGGLTTGDRSIELALHVQFQGALGVVLNKPTPNVLIGKLKEKIAIPVIITIVSEKDHIKGRIAAGVYIFNVSGAKKTPDIVNKIRDIDDTIAILATGGKTDETISKCIKAGTNAISYTPPSTADLFKEIRIRYRNEP